MFSSPHCHRHTLVLQNIQLRLYTRSNTVMELVVSKEYPLVSNLGDIDDIGGFISGSGVLPYIGYTDMFRGLGYLV